MDRRPEEFDYLNSNLSEPFNKKIRIRSNEMFDTEVRERARLLFNLRFSVDKAISRIRNNIEWEFDQTWNRSNPAILEQLDSIVRDYYSKMQGKLD